MKSAKSALAAVLVLSLIGLAFGGGRTALLMHAHGTMVAMR
jgi:hypothetical protein